MNEIEKAIDILKNMAEDCEDCKYYEECNGNDICHDAQDHVFEFALQAQAERDKMRCENCKHWANGLTEKRPCHKTDAYPMTASDFCSYFEQKEINTK